MLAPVVPAVTGVSPGLTVHERAASEIEASWWQKRERVRQQPLPRLQLYAFDTSQAADELYAFTYDRKEVRHFYSQSRNNGERMGELEAVEGYGRADIMAIAWTRKGGADFELVFYGHNMISLAEGYVIKSDVRGKLTWVVKLTRLYGEVIRALTSQRLFSAPVYPALASGLKFGLEDPKGGFGTIDIEGSANKMLASEMSKLGLVGKTASAGCFSKSPQAPSMPTPVVPVAAAAMPDISEEDELMAEFLPPPMQSMHQPGRMETGSFFMKQQAEAVTKGIEEKAGFKWTVVHPWDGNRAIAGISKYTPFTVPNASATNTAINIQPVRKVQPVGVIFPTRGTPVAGQGQFVHRMTIEAIPITQALEVTAAHPIAAYHAKLYNNEYDKPFAAVDILPDVRRSADGKTMTASRFLATPSLGHPWIGQSAAETVTIDKRDVRRCVEGEICPWSLDLVSHIEAGVYKLKLGARA